VTLIELCDAIEAGYAAGKSGLDDDMLDLLIELGDRTEEIKQLVTDVNRANTWYELGRPLFDSNSFGAMFSLGAWWADRPWRNKEQP
jgi:hypothetical protein